MESQRKGLRLAVPTGWADVLVRTLKAALVAFVALQLKEYLDVGELDIPGWVIDGGWVAGVAFLLNTVLMWASPSPAR